MSPMASAQASAQAGVHAGGGPAPLCTEDGTLNEREETAQRIETRRERDATLRAVLRIGASVDLDTMFRKVVDVARALTGARYGHHHHRR